MRECVLLVMTTIALAACGGGETGESAGVRDLAGGLIEKALASF